jgi:hypothetical protein
LTIVAKTVVRMIPTSRSPGKPTARSAIVITIPTTVMITGHVVKGARSTIVPCPWTTIPDVVSPMNAMNRPIPIAIAFFSSSGIALMIASRSPRSTRIVIASPSTTTRPIASGKLRPACATSVNATTALRPSPGAIA